MFFVCLFTLSLRLYPRRNRIHQIHTSYTNQECICLWWESSLSQSFTFSIHERQQQKKKKLQANRVPSVKSDFGFFLFLFWFSSDWHIQHTLWTASMHFFYTLLRHRHHQRLKECYSIRCTMIRFQAYLAKRVSAAAPKSKNKKKNEMTTKAPYGETVKCEKYALIQRKQWNVKMKWNPRTNEVKRHRTPFRNSFLFAFSSTKLCEMCRRNASQQTKRIMQKLTQCTLRVNGWLNCFSLKWCCLGLGWPRRHRRSHTSAARE